MLPIRNRSIFKSRWMALLWAGGILWSAAEFVGSQPGAKPDAGNASASTDSDTLNAAQAAQLSATLNQFDSIR